MFWLIMSIVYVAGWVLFAPILARLLWVEMREDEDAKFDMIMAACLGLIVAFFWPLVVPVGYVYRRAFPKKEDQ